MRLLKTPPIAVVGRGTCTQPAPGPRSGGRLVSALAWFALAPFALVPFAQRSSGGQGRRSSMVRAVSLDPDTGRARRVSQVFRTAPARKDKQG